MGSAAMHGARKIGERMKAIPALLALYLILIAGLGAAGYHFYVGQQQRTEDDARNQLVAIADLKVAQIAEWRRERIADGKAMQASAVMVPVVRRLLAGSASGGTRAVLVDWLSTLKSAYGYANVMLVDSRQAVLLSLVSGARLEAPCAAIVREAMRTSQVSLTDLHLENGSGAIHLALVVPVVVSGRNTAIGAFVLWIDPNAFLYPHVQSWPTPSRTAETLLVRREGDQVLYLNELRHRNGTALGLRVLIGPARGRLPAADAVSGRQGAWNGIDYRGIPVLATARRVPGSPWYLVAKVDADEVNTPIQQRSELVAFILLLSVLAVGPAVGLVWYRQRSRLQLVRRESEVARQALVEHFSYLSRYANDIILLEDESGRIVEANERAEQSYGYDRGELLALNIRDLHESSSLAGFEARWEAAKKPGGILFETTHRRRDGSVFPVEVSARVIEVDGEGFRQSIIRDITERKRAEEELRESEARYRLLVETSGEAIFLTAEDGAILSANPEACRILGRSEAEICRVGRDAIVDLNDPRLAPALAESERTGRFAGELNCVRKDGTVFPAEVSVVVFKDSAGHSRASTFVRDISERKRAAAELNTAHTRLEALWSINSLIGVDFKTLCDHVLSTVVRMTGSDYGFYGFMSDDESVMTIHSWSGEAMKDCSLVDKPEHFPIPEAGVWGEAVRHRKPLILNDYSAAHAGRKGCPEGHVRFHNLLVVPTFARGKIVSLMAVANRVAGYGEADVQQVTAFMEGIHSITERKRMEDALRVKDWAIESAINSLAISDVEGNLSYVNPAFLKLWGYTSPAEVLGKPAVEFWQVGEIAAQVMEAVRTKGGWIGELAAQGKDGALFDIQVAANMAVDDAGQPICMLASFLDITERKRAQEEIEKLNRELEQRVQQRTAELEASNKELEAFTYSVSHDLRAPLRAIHGFSRLLEAEHAAQLSLQARHYLEMVRRNALQMGDLIDSLLALSRLGRQPLRTQTVAPAALARQAWEELGGEREGRRVEFAAGELPSCTADPALLKQVFANLLGNALKYSRLRETARVEIGCSTMANSCVYWVRDNGAGFDMRYADKLFGVFQRLHSQAEYEGSGIGLAIAQRIVQRHGGRIWAEAKLDEGATFWFTIGDAALGGKPRQDELTKEPKS